MSVSLCILLEAYYSNSIRSVLALMNYVDVIEMAFCVTQYWHSPVRANLTTLMIIPMTVLSRVSDFVVGAGHCSTGTSVNGTRHLSIFHDGVDIGGRPFRVLLFF